MIRKVKTKKSVVVFTSFTLVLFFALAVMSFSYMFYYNKVDLFETKIRDIEVTNSALNLRTSLMKLNTQENSTITYQNNLDDRSILIYLNNNSIIGKSKISNTIVKQNISNLGLNFCGDYEIIPQLKSNFKMNKNCIEYIPN